MAIDTSMQVRDLYLKTTDTDGRTTYTEHRVWDPGRFLLAREADAAKLNAKAAAKGEPAKACAEQITRDQFKARA